MRSMFVSPDVGSQGVWKEILWGLIITVLVYLVSSIAVETITKGGTPRPEAAEWVCWGVGIVMAASFGMLRFPPLALVLIAIGAGLNVRGSFGFDRVPGIYECAAGLLLTVRGFSIGPTPQP